MLKVRDLTLHYGGSQILYDISMEAEAGKVTCVMGTNGVGKTSLLKALSGTHQRTSGEIEFDGEAIGKVPAHVLAHKGVGYVPQGRMIFPLLTVKENMETAYACLPRSEHHIPDEIYELFPILKEFLGRRGGDLSGGQQQQLAIARAMLTKPKLLLLDEPTEGIQPNIIQQIGRVIEYLRDKGDMAIILVEQDLNRALAFADRILCMAEGRAELQGAPSDFTRAQISDAYFGIHRQEAAHG